MRSKKLQGGHVLEDLVGFSKDLAFIWNDVVNGRVLNRAGHNLIHSLTGSLWEARLER